MFAIRRTVSAVVIVFLLFTAMSVIASEITTTPSIYFTMGGPTGSSPEELLSNHNSAVQMKLTQCLSGGAAVCSINRLSSPSPSANAVYRNGVANVYDVQTEQTSYYKDSNGGWQSTTVSPIAYQAIVMGSSCPNGFDLILKKLSDVNNQQLYCRKVEQSSCPDEGNPINVGTGDKFEQEIDFATSDGLLRVERNYVNQNIGWQLQDQYQLIYVPADSGSAITAGYSVVTTRKRYSLDSANPTSLVTYIYTDSVNYVNPAAQNYAFLIMGRQRYKFLEINNVFVGDGPVGAKSELIRLSFSGVEQWKFTNSTGDSFYFSATGVLIRKDFITGGSIFYTYSNNKLIAQQDHAGRQLSYNYDTYDRLSSITLPDGQEISYQYGDDENETDFSLLQKVIWPNGESIGYIYNEASNIAGVNTLKMLTGKLDATGNRIGIYKYNNGKAISTEGALGSFKRTFLHSSPTTVTDGLNSQTKYYFNTLADGTRLVTRTDRPAGSGCAASTNAATYYTYGLLKSQTDFNGNKTQFAYDTTRALETVRVEGIAKADTKDYLPSNTVLAAGAKKITTQWHNIYRKPLRKIEPKLSTTFIYNGDADPFNNNEIASCSPSSRPLLCHKVLQATTDANGTTGINATIDTTIAKREVFYTYNDLGQQLTYSRTGVGVPDEVREYYDITTSEWTKGDLKSITNALGQKIEFTRYDPNGRMLAMQDANGVQTLFTYDARGRVASQSVAGATTTHAYDLNGNRITSVLPNGVTIHYEYDAAKRLIAVVNALGDKINYEYDVESHVRFERFTNTSGVNTYTKEHVYDALARVKNTLNSSSQGSTYLYDANGNLTSEVDAKTQTTSNTFDPLDRLTRTTDALTGKTDYSYDAQGNLTQVKDPKGNSTIYNYNAFGDLTSQTSPDTGTATFTYDAAGNRASSMDARGIVMNYSYDALNRLIAIQFPAAASENITYNYDATANGNYGIGRLTSIVTGTTRLDFEYSPQGLITKKYAQAANTSVSTQYRYDAAGNLTGVTYPSSREVNYQLDTAGRISSISTKANATASEQTLISDVSYLPFGPAQSYSYGNGLSHTQTYDLDYRITGIQIGGILNRSYGYDLVNNITSINNSLNTANSQTFSYDALNRLITAVGGYGNLGYGYDAVGNRLQETRNGVSDTYAYQTTSNRLTGITRATGNRNFTYDAAGNPAQRTAADNSNQTFSFNNANRLNSVNVNGALAATYTYNPLGQRVVKTLVNGSKEIYHYDEAGQLIAVTDAAGTTIREYIYWGAQQVALVNNGTLYFIHSDHLNTPQVVTNASQQVVWMGDYEPFGKLAQNQTNSIELYSRFPGQYLDGETGLYYNYFRDYDSSIGRYIESDPIGLGGGINTYGYAYQNSISLVDIFGLAIWWNGKNGWTDIPSGSGWVPYNPGLGPSPQQSSGSQCDNNQSTGNAPSESPIPSYPLPNVPPFNFDEYMNGVIARVSAFEENLARERRECFMSTILGEAGTQALGSMGVAAGAASSSAFWRAAGTKFVPVIGWISTGMTAGSMGRCIGMR